MRTTTASETSQVTSNDESSPLTPTSQSPRGIKRRMIKDLKLDALDKNQTKRRKIPRKLVGENSHQMNQKAKSKNRNPEETIPPNPPPSPAQSIGTPTRDEEPRTATPTTQPTTYREYHSSDEASDPGGYELIKPVQPQQQLTDECAEAHLLDYEPEGVAEVEDSDDSEDEVELSEEEKLRLQEEMRLRERHLKKLARIRRRAEKESKSGASF